MNLRKAVKNYLDNHYEDGYAQTKVCLDIIFSKLANGKYRKSVTIKGGAMMQVITKDVRRGTKDLDIDVAHLSMSDESIISFINSFNDGKDNLKFEIIDGPIMLKHQDYRGKRVSIKITDSTGYYLYCKLDIGVQDDLDIQQDEIYVDLITMDEQVALFFNSKEQSFAEKLKSLLIYEAGSTRYKDIFDIYYIINSPTFDIDRFKKYVDKFIFSYAPEIYIFNYKDIYNSLSDTFSDNLYKIKLAQSAGNWLSIDPDKAFKAILDFFKKLI